MRPKRATLRHGETGAALSLSQPGAPSAAAISQSGEPSESEAADRRPLLGILPMDDAEKTELADSWTKYASWVKDRDPAGWSNDEV